MTYTVLNCFTAWGDMANDELHVIGREIVRLGGGGPAIEFAIWDGHVPEGVNLGMPTIRVSENCREIIVLTAGDSPDRGSSFNVG